MCVVSWAPAPVCCCFAALLLRRNANLAGGFAGRPLLSGVSCLVVFAAHGRGSYTFFFLWYGRSRSKARSLHEKKLLLRKLLHGHRWSHAAGQIITTKTQTTKNKRQDADPPARYASHHPKDSKANSERGKSPTETNTKDLPRTQW